MVFNGSLAGQRQHNWHGMGVGPNKYGVLGVKPLENFPGTHPLCPWETPFFVAKKQIGLIKLNPQIKSNCQIKFVKGDLCQSFIIGGCPKIYLVHFKMYW